MSKTKVNEEIDNLEKAFNVDAVRAEVTALRSRIKNLDSYSDPNEVLRMNIERANTLLDRLEEEIDNPTSTPRGGIARLMEVASTLINTVTTAANSMMSLTFNEQDVAYKDKVLTLKESELDIKRLVANKQPTQGALTQNNQIVLTNRNDLLDLLRKPEPVAIETQIQDLE